MDTRCGRCKDHRSGLCSYFLLQYTPVDTLVFGGNFLHSYNMATRTIHTNSLYTMYAQSSLQNYEFERSKSPHKYQRNSGFPCFPSEYRILTTKYPNTHGLDQDFAGTSATNTFETSNHPLLEHHSHPESSHQYEPSRTSWSRKSAPWSEGQTQRRKKSKTKSPQTELKMPQRWHGSFDGAPTSLQGTVATTRMRARNNGLMGMGMATEPGPV